MHLDSNALYNFDVSRLWFLVLWAPGMYVSPSLTGHAWCLSLYVFRLAGGREHCGRMSAGSD